MPLLPNGNIRQNAYEQLKIINIESLFTAFFMGYYLYETGFHIAFAILGGLILLLGLKLIFHFKLGYLIISILFSGFWAFCFSIGWFRDGNWFMGILFGAVIFPACLYGHKVNYEEDN